MDVESPTSASHPPFLSVVLLVFLVFEKVVVVVGQPLNKNEQ